MIMGEKGMTVIGIGEKLGLSTLPYLALTIYLSYRYPVFGTDAYPREVLIYIGVFLIIVGLSVNFTSASRLMKAYKSGKLLTTGLYGITRNPMYASFILITIPGLALVLNSWLILTVSIWMLIFFKIHIRKEEIYLAEKFGNQYKKYCRSVGQLIPRIK